MEYKSEERTDSRQRISQEFITTFFLWKEAVIAYTFLDGGCVLFCFFFLLFLVNNYLLPLNRDVDSWNKYTLG